MKEIEYESTFMQARNYTSPLDRLLQYGEPSTIQKWQDYSEIGIGMEHIRDLIDMLTDEDLNWADADSQEVWAPVHAWRALGQLRATEAIEPLIQQLDLIDDEEGDDWIGEEFPQVFAMIGPSAIDPLEEYLANSDNGLFSRICAAYSLASIGEAHPASTEKCQKAITIVLEGFSRNDPDLNGFLISYLVDLKAVDSLNTIREAYQQGCVDIGVLGDLEDAEVLLGVREKRSTPSPKYNWSFDGERPATSVTRASKKAKIGRNDPCPCGSGKKYKKCCLK